MGEDDRKKALEAFRKEMKLKDSVSLDEIHVRFAVTWPRWLRSWELATQAAHEWNESEKSPPRDGSEFLTRNDRCGGTLSIARWSNVFGYFVSKGEHLHQFTHWCLVSPKAPSNEL